MALWRVMLTLGAFLLVSGPCAFADEYLWDFHFDAASGFGYEYAAADVVYLAPQAAFTLPFYPYLSHVSGDLDGTVPGSILWGGSRGLDGGGWVTQWQTQGDYYDVPAGDVDGFFFDVMQPTGVGIYPTYDDGILVYGGAVREIRISDTDTEVVGALGSLTVTDLTSTPEPGSWGLVGSGVLGLVGVMRRRISGGVR